MSARRTFWTVIGFVTFLVTGKVLGALILGTGLDTPRLASMFVAYSLVSYLCYSLTFVRAWNERAQELTQLQETRG
jgi:threonine/homoserine/homoserine lactone efflux protein